jgi:hypothetical protein
VVDKREVLPFFQKFQIELSVINDQPETACNNLVARNPVFFQKSLFRAFLHLTKEECDKMTLTEYMDYTVMLKKTLELIHAPFMKE